MRILIVHPGPDFSVHDVYTGWLEAFQELGVTAHGYNLLPNDRLIFYSTALRDTGEKDEQGLPIVRNYLTQDQAFIAARQGLSHEILWKWPDVVLFISAFFMTATWFRLLRARRIKTVILHTESPYQDEEQLIRGSLADLNLINDPQNLEKFRELGPAEYQHHCYRPSVHYPRAGPRNQELASDFAFIGTAFKSRIELFEALDLNGIDTILAGNCWGALPGTSPVAKYVATGIGTDADCVHNHEAADLYRNTRISLNFYRREAEEDWSGEGVAMGPREIELAACGTFFLRDPRPEGDEVLHMLPRFSSPAEASEQLHWWLAHDREREKIAGQAREAIADRTFADSARRLLTKLDTL